MNRGRESLSSVSSSSSIKTEALKQREMSTPTSLNSHLLLDDTQKERLFSLLKGLQEEIQDLKYENNELKFLLFVALKHVAIDEKAQKDDFKWEMENMARDYLEDSTGTKTLRLELEATTNLLEESKWIQNHYGQRVREQELQIQELQKQLMDMKTKEFTLVQLKLPATTDYRISRKSNRSGDGSPARQIKPSGRQRSLSTASQHRGQGLNTFLPDNYKDTVATLPPILDGRKHKTRPTKFWPQMKNAT
ncbi:unnamed protein product [Allacma fusca]|uniref:Uncharacterized protein n=1 Tax=Allacma fusca TaxID=39272 RepID=A0A8J2PCH9_9HEXA|nr:unnamed protein product [Allacma fusca]